MCPVNLCGSRTYIVKTRFAGLALTATVLLLSGCYHHHYRDDGGWRDDDDRQWRGDRYGR
ncbi:hypothetical protein F3J44_11605 [Pantoea sp. Tr-811]|nr:hypothetical protein [Pantoea sp. Tr-811]